MKIASVQGVEIRISLISILVCGLGMWLGITETVLAAAALIMHELAHVLTAGALGLTIQRVELFPLGGQIMTEELVGVEPTKEIGSALAGPLVSLFLAMLTYIMKVNLEISGISFFMQFNLALGLFNLLPAVPLDGGRVFKSVLSMLVGFKSAALVACYVSMASALILLGTGTWLVFKDWLAINIILVAVFLVYKAHGEHQMLPYDFARYLIRKRRILVENQPYSGNLIMARDDLQVRAVLNRSRPRSCMVVIVYDHRGLILGFLIEQQLIGAYFEEGYTATLRTLLDEPPKKTI
ncbi:MAG: M50 family metallopeptidase [Ignavibacteriales bacterium]